MLPAGEADGVERVRAAGGAVAVALAPPQLAARERVRGPQVAAEAGVHDRRAGDRGRAVVAVAAREHAPVGQRADLEPLAALAAAQHGHAARPQPARPDRPALAARRAQRRVDGAGRVRAPAQLPVAHGTRLDDAVAALAVRDGEHLRRREHGTPQCRRASAPPRSRDRRRRAPRRDRGRSASRRRAGRRTERTATAGPGAAAASAARPCRGRGR